MTGPAGAKGYTGLVAQPGMLTYAMADVPTLTLANPATGGTAVKVGSGGVDFSNATGVRMRVYVRAFWAPSPDTQTSLFAYCNVGDTLIGGGCHLNNGSIALSRMEQWTRGTTIPPPHANDADPTSCADLYAFNRGNNGAYTVPPAADSSQAQAFWHCIVSNSGGSLEAQAVCMKGY